MRRNVTIGVVLVLLLGLVVWWKFLRGGEDATPGGGSGAVTSGSGTAGPGKTGKASAPNTKVTLSGHVTRAADGSAVAGAMITIDRKQGIGAFFDQMREHEDPPLATTDKDGSWTLKDVAPGTYNVSATGPLLLAGLREVSVAGVDVGGIDFALAAGGAIVSGTVSDVLGGPIPGVRVQARRSGNNPFAKQPSIIAITDDKGAYQLALKPGTFTFSATHEAYTAGVRFLEMTEDPVTVDFTLTPGATIRGQVVTADGKPVPDASVAASPVGQKFNVAAFGGGATTDEQGNFTLKSLSPGALALTAVGGGYATVSPTVVEVGIGEQVDGVRVVVEKGFSISGHVVEKGTTKGIAGVRVGVFSIAQAEAGMSRAPSGDDGAFTVDGLRAASYMLFAIGDEVMPEIGKPVEIVDKDVSGVTVEMAAGVTITGRVEPAAVASISIEPTAIGFANMFDAMKSFMVKADSDTYGNFTLKHAPPGTFKLKADTQDGRAGEVPLVVDTTDKTGVVVKLEKQASIAGKVVDSTGAPVSDVEVHAQPTKKREGGAFSMEMGGRGGGASSRPRADGSFQILGLEAGTYGLRVTDGRGRVGWATPANKDKPNAPIEVEVATAADKTGVTLVVETRDGTIKGNVVMPDGKPAADTWITVSMERGRPKVPTVGATDDKKGPARDEMDYDEMRAQFTGGGGYAPVITNAEGRFSIEKLRRGTYKVVGENAKGSARGQKDAVKTGDTITLQLGRLGMLTGKVTINGAPAVPYDIECDQPGKAMASHDARVTDKSGVYTLERLPPGEYECDVTADGGKATEKVTVPAGDLTRDIALVPWASVKGTVVSVLTGEPVTGVKLMTGMGRSMDRAALTDLLGGKGPTSDARGAFTLTRVAPGPSTLVVMPATGGFQPLAQKEFEAKAGQVVDVGAIKIVPPRSGDPGTLGIGTDTEGGKLTVADIKAGGPGEAAGVQVGDRIASINGMDVATLTPDIAQTLIGSGNISAGQKFILGLDRGGTIQQVTVVAAKW